MAYPRRALIAGAALVLLSTAVAVPAARAATMAGFDDPVFDPPTQSSIGIRVPISPGLGPKASVAVRYRRAGAADWHDALALHRVNPDNVPPVPVHQTKDPAEFGGSIVDLDPGTGYDIELRLDDGAGGTAVVDT